jgi:probable rRNA maturation factor
VNLVDVFNATRVELDAPAVARLVSVVLREEGVDHAELAVQFVGEGRMRALNGEHRGRHEVTDVLSFPLEDAGETAGHSAATSEDPARRATAAAGPPRLLGDVVVCARRALRQARTDDLPPAFELAVLLIHGVLHLLGHDHEVDAGQMALRQAEILELVDWEALLVVPSR